MNHSGVVAVVTDCDGPFRGGDYGGWFIYIFFLKPICHIYIWAGGALKTYMKKDWFLYPNNLSDIGKYFYNAPVENNKSKCAANLS